MIYFGPNPYTGNGFYFGDPFDLLNGPTPDEELIALIYLMLNLTTSDIPTEIVQIFLDEYQKLYPDNDCMVLYNTTISIYNWLIRKANGEAVGGKRKEKKGRREIEVQDYSTTDNWKNSLKSFLANPWEVYPQCRSTLAENASSRLIIGGVKKDIVESVQDNTNSYSQYDERYSYAPHTPDEDKDLI